MGNATGNGPLSKRPGAVAWHYVGAWYHAVLGKCCAAWHGVVGWRRIAVVLLLVACALLLVAWVSPLPRELRDLRGSSGGTLRLEDRRGNLLREVHSSTMGVSHWVALEDMSPSLVQATLLSEDRRFYYHLGSDPLALLRALWVNVRARRVLMGGSTITQQLVRTLAKPCARSWQTKIRENWLALCMELHYSKHDILESYLNRIAFGRGVYGVEDAALEYYGKSSRSLSPAESAALAILPRAPGDFDLRTHLEEVEPWQRQLLARMQAHGILTSDEYRLAIGAPLFIQPLRENSAAPHFCDYILDNLELVPVGAVRLRTTIDLPLQQEAERLVGLHLSGLAKCNVTNAAVVVLEADSGEVLAWVGSRDYLDREEGQVDGVTALRQPGSALKPFLYELALEQGYTASSLLPDLKYSPVRAIDAFVPHNYDMKVHGPVRLRSALACSYNVSATWLLQRVGIVAFLKRLHALGFQSLRQNADHYGLALALGDGEVTLLELASAYRALAREGVWGPPRVLLQAWERDDQTELPLPVDAGQQHVSPSALAGDSTAGAGDSTVGVGDSTVGVGDSTVGVGDSTVGVGDSAVGVGDSAVGAGERAVMGRRECFVMRDILSDASARAPAFGLNCVLRLPFPCAAKTGTSKSYRDNWTVGYTSRYVVGVWVGNFSGASMQGVSGVSGAGPLFRSLMLALARRDRQKGTVYVSSLQGVSEPAGIVERQICPASGALVGSDCNGVMSEYFLTEHQPKERCQVHRAYVIDRRSGALASEKTPSQYRERRVYTVFPPLYREWMEDHGYALPPREVKSPVVGEHADEHIYGKPGEVPGHDVEVAIVSPAEKTVYRIDPVLRREYQQVTLRAQVPEGTAEVEWLMDGQSLGRVASPFRRAWQLQPGQHRVGLRCGERLVEREFTVID